MVAAAYGGKWFHVEAKPKVVPFGNGGLLGKKYWEQQTPENVSSRCHLQGSTELPEGVGP